MPMSTDLSTESSFASRCHQATCRSCGTEGLHGILDLGRMPPSDRFLSEDELDQPEAMYPLELAFCPKCALVQILETVDPSRLFGAEYVYRSSFSDALLQHSRENALHLMQTRRLDETHLVVELASNDGYLLKNFVEHEIPVLGIDPAPQPVAAANAAGVPTRCDFFTRELAQELVAEGRQANVLIANNVLAHVAETNGFVEGIAMLLRDDGVASLEFPYVRDLVEKCEFDTIYHEHLCYFSLTALVRLFRRHGLSINRVWRLPIHGGSLRIHVERSPKPSESVRAMLAEERSLGMQEFGYYARFAERVNATRDQLIELTTQLKFQGHSIAAYGAAAKGTILTNFAGLGRETIDFVVDRNIHKHGKYTPGQHLPICEPSALMEQRPDYVLLLVWNFQQEVLRQQQAYRDAGGKFIIPIPSPEIV